MKFYLGLAVILILGITNVLANNTSHINIVCHTNGTDVWPPISWYTEYVVKYNFSILVTDLNKADVLVAGDIAIPNPPILKEHSVYNVTRYTRGWTNVVEKCEGDAVERCWRYDRFLIKSTGTYTFKSCYEIKTREYNVFIKFGYYIVLGVIIVALAIMITINVVVCLIRRARARHREYTEIKDEPELIISIGTGVTPSKVESSSVTPSRAESSDPIDEILY